MDFYLGFFSACLLSLANASEFTNQASDFENCGFNLSATCDDVMWLFADGDLLVNHSSDWRVTSEVHIPANTKVIEIHCLDSWIHGGILAASNNGLITNDKWNCTSDNRKTWKSAFLLGKNGRTAPDISPEAIWIWTDMSHWMQTDHRRHTKAICKIELETSQCCPPFSEPVRTTTLTPTTTTATTPSKPKSGFKLTATCDNEMKLFVDGNLEATSSNWRDTSQVIIPAYTEAIEIHCMTSGIVGGILASSDKALLTDGAWNCSSDNGTTWNPAYEVGPNGGAVPDISPQAEWIWTRCIGDWTSKYTGQNYQRNIICKIDLIIDGGWSKWSPFSPCSASCGDETKARTRTCSNPPPRNGGLPCLGLEEEVVSCGHSPCISCPYTDKYRDCLNWKKNCESGPWKTCMEENCPKTCKCGEWKLGMNINPCDGENFGYGGPWAPADNVGSTNESLTKDFVDSSVWKTPASFVTIARHVDGQCTMSKTWELTDKAKSMYDYFSTYPGRIYVTGDGSVNDNHISSDIPEAAEGLEGTWRDPIFGAEGGLVFNWYYSNNGARIAVPGGYKIPYTLPSVSDNGEDLHGLGNELSGQTISGKGGGEWSDVAMIGPDCHGRSALTCKVVGTDRLDYSKHNGPCWGSYAIFVSQNAKVFSCQGRSLSQIINAGAIDGMWSTWSEYSLCSVTCGNATKRRSRTCSNPPPSNGGETCPGLEEEVVSCGLSLCDTCVSFCSSIEGCSLVRNTLMTTLTKLAKEFFISFEYKATSYGGSYQSVIHLTEDGDCCDVGKRIPGVWTIPGGRLHLSFSIGGSGNYHVNTEKYPVGQWHQAEFSQILKNGKYIYRVNINGKNVVEVENKDPRVFSNVKVYAADPWWPSQEGSIRNFFINNEATNKCEDTSICGGKDSGCCTPSSPCGIDDGDCDSDRDCKPGLVCGTDNCPNKGVAHLDVNTWDRTDDCCIRSVSLKLDNEVPYILIGSKWMPICGHYFWDNNIGADIVCQNLGYSKGGVLEKIREAYSEDAYYVGRCDSRSITDLVNGCTKEILAAQSSCEKGNPVSIKVKCKDTSVCGGKDSGCCTPSSPCGIDDGDCDSDRDCKPGLVCGTDNCPNKGVAHLDVNTWDRTDDCCTPSGQQRRKGFRKTNLSGRFKGSTNIPILPEQTVLELQFQLKGKTGTEKVKISVDDNEEEFVLKKEWQDFSYPLPSIGSFSVEFLNDIGYTDVFIRGHESQVTDLLPNFPANKFLGCGTKNEDQKCDLLRKGTLLWNGKYTYTLKGQ